MTNKASSKQIHNRILLLLLLTIIIISMILK